MKSPSLAVECEVNVKKIMVLFGVFLGLIILLVPTIVLAGGVALGPQTTEISNALRGGQYSTVVTIFNPSTETDTYTIGAEGQASRWVSFYDWNSKQPILKNMISLGGQSNEPILIEVNVPSDAADGSYPVTIYAQTAPEGDIGKSGVSAVMKATSILTIGVTGIQTLDGSVESINVNDTEVGRPLEIDVSFTNSGNVATKPTIDCQISNGNTKVTDFSYSDTTISPGTQGTILVEWATGANPIGDYIAHVIVSLGDKTIYTQDLQFKIVPAGSLSIAGVLNQLTLDNKPNVGKISTIKAVFNNTGLGDITGQLVGQIYRDSSLVGTFNGASVVVHAGSQGTLTASFQPDQQGNYIIKGHVLYQGKTTEDKQITIAIGSVAQKNSFNPMILIMSGVGLLLIVIVVLMLRSRVMKKG